MLLFILGTIAVVMWLPTFMLLLQCVAGSLPARGLKRSPQNTSGAARLTVDVLMPAHNEQAVIAATLRSVLPQLLPGDRLMVVADNCTDQTAQIASSLGATVVERCDADRRAKGYAVAFGLDAMRQDSRQVVVMIDADCHLEAGTIDRLVDEVAKTGSPVQAMYRMPESRSTDGSAWNAVSAFAVTVKNQVRPVGLHRLGFGCILYGSGMAFPADLARQPQWASDNIVEDMKVSYDLMIAGKTPRFCPAAIVTATLPEARDSAVAQRRRWEHGHLQTIVTQVPRLLLHAIGKFRPALLVAALDLIIPPLALLVQVWLSVTICVALVTLGSQAPTWPLLLLIAAGANIGLAIGVAWFVHGREQVSFKQLCSVPFYVLSKLPLYASAVFRRQRAWQRTARDASEGVCV